MVVALVRNMILPPFLKVRFFRFFFVPQRYIFYIVKVLFYTFEEQLAIIASYGD